MKKDLLLEFGEGEVRTQCWGLGRVGYQEAWDFQKDWVQKRIAGEVPDALFFCEHDPVITLGRGAQREPDPLVALQKEIPVLAIERGGHSTYHGPGQLVVYPIMQLRRKQSAWARSGVVNLIRTLEDWMMGYLAEQGLATEAICEKTGVWVTQPGPAGIAEPAERKIASIGIAVKRWVSYHGMAINISTGLDPWKALNPCGFASQVMTDLNRETGMTQSIDSAQRDLLAKAQIHFLGERQGRQGQLENNNVGTCSRTT